MWDLLRPHSGGVGMSKKTSSRKIVVVSFLVDLIDVVTNLVVAILTGSATVFSEMAQGIADSIGSMLLVIGERRSKKPPDKRHPLGHAREAFFWGLISAVVMLIVGGGLSLWRGLQQWFQPEPVESPWLAIAVISFAVMTNSYAVFLSSGKLRAELGSLRAIFSNFSHPLVKGAFLRDLVGVSTSIFGLIAMAGYMIFQSTVFDAVGALVAAVMMLVSSLLLIVQSHALITGQTLPDNEIDRIRNSILGIQSIEAVNHLVAIYAGATEIILEADLDLSDNLTTTEIERLLDTLEVRVRTEVPSLHRVRVLLNSPVETK